MSDFSERAWERERYRRRTIAPAELALWILGALLLLTGAFGRHASKLELGFSWLHPTEVLLAVAVVAAIIAPRQPRVVALRRSGALWPLLGLWLFGVIALARGILDWGFEKTLYDVGLVEYSLLVALVAILVNSRREFLLLCQLLALSGLLAIMVAAVSLWAPPAWNLVPSLGLVPAATGMYVLLYVAWVAARSAAGLSIPSWSGPVAIIGVALIFVGLARSVWLALIAATLCAVLLAIPARRLGVAAGAATVIALGVAIAPAAGDLEIEVPSPSGLAGSLIADSPVAVSDSRLALDPRSPPAATGTPAAGSSPSADGTSGAADGSPAAGPVPAREDRTVSPPSLSLNSGIEAGTARGYEAVGNDAVEPTRQMSFAGSYALEARYADDLRLARTDTVALAQSGPLSVAAWVYVPSRWDGGAVSISTDQTWTGAAEDTQTASTETTGRWSRIEAQVDPSTTDLTGGVHIRAASAPSGGASVFIDNLTVRPTEGSNAMGVVAADAATSTGVFDEVSASFGDSPQQANGSWRLAFWGEMLRTVARNPLLGAGFGRPSDFEWNGVHYDRRTGDAKDPFDVSGPHNSFVNLVYRVGLPGLIALMAMMLLAVARVLPIARTASGEDRAIAIWLLAALVITSVIASFNVALEGPFMGIFFWTILGLALIAPRFLSSRSRSEPLTRWP